MTGKDDFAADWWAEWEQYLTSAEPEPPEATAPQQGGPIVGEDHPPAIDIDQYRLTPEDLAAYKAPIQEPAAIPRRTKRKSRPELRSQVDFPFRCLPVLWVEKLQGARYAATWKLAAHLLEMDWKQYRKAFQEGEPISLANGWLKACNLSRRGKSNGLREMRDLGLIDVQYRARKAPLVTLTKPPPATEEGN
jgi:hypothetical protein